MGALVGFYGSTARPRESSWGIAVARFWDSCLLTALRFVWSSPRLENALAAILVFAVRSMT